MNVRIPCFRIHSYDYIILKNHTYFLKQKIYKAKFCKCSFYHDSFFCLFVISLEITAFFDCAIRHIKHICCIFFIAGIRRNDG